MRMVFGGWMGGSIGGGLRAGRMSNTIGFAKISDKSQIVVLEMVYRQSAISCQTLPINCEFGAPESEPFGLVWAQTSVDLAQLVPLRASSLRDGTKNGHDRER